MRLGWGPSGSHFPAAQAEIEAALESAAAIVQKTRARSYEPLVREERARLARVLGDEAMYESGIREAHQLFSEMDAVGDADRLAEELGP